MVVKACTAIDAALAILLIVIGKVEVGDRIDGTTIILLENVVPGVLGNDDKLYGLPEELAQEIQDEAFFPDGLLCSLRRYQEWGVKYILHQGKALPGDEMGLGKTIITLTAIGKCSLNHYMGNVTPQVMLEDFEIVR